MRLRSGDLPWFRTHRARLAASKPHPPGTWRPTRPIRACSGGALPGTGMPRLAQGLPSDSFRGGAFHEASPFPIAGVEIRLASKGNRSEGRLGRGNAKFRRMPAVLDAGTRCAAEIALREARLLGFVPRLAEFVHDVVVRTRKAGGIEEILIIADAQCTRGRRFSDRRETVRHHFGLVGCERTPGTKLRRRDVD